ncbi:MAG: HlyD family efflux transporter periplasmic adaptor subunit, partial [Oscillospiraceae bacterium]
MKKYAVLTAITFSIMAGLLSVFALAEAFLPNVSIVALRKMPYTDTVTVNGTLETVKKKEVLLDFPIVPSEVMAQVGKVVKVGDVLAKIDINATKNAIAKLAHQYLDLVPAELKSALENFDLEGVLKQDSFPTEIVSTVSGTVTSLALTEGTLSFPRSAVATVETTNALRGRFFVSENDAEKIREGKKVLFTANATEDTLFSATIIAVAPAAYQRFSGLSYDTVVDVVAKMDASYSALKSGYTIKGKVPISEEREVSMLPYEAIQQDENGTEYVYIYQNGNAVR